jgi:hypothetical protein
MSKFYLICTYIILTAMCSCVQNRAAVQENNAEILRKPPPTVEVKSNNSKWIKTEVPFGKSGEVIIFDNKGSAAIVGKGFLLLSRDDGNSWREMKGGKGSDLYTNDGGKTYKNNDGKDAGKNESLISINRMCSVEKAVFAPDGKRLYVFCICEHHAELWSIPTNGDSDSWQVISFVSDEKDYETGPYQHLVLAGDKVLVDAVFPQGISLLSTNDSGKTWNAFWSERQAPRSVGLDFIDEQRGWMLLGDGKLLRTENKGRTWETFSQIPAEAIGEITSLDFVSSTNGFIAGDKGLIFATKDGGQTWQRQVSGTDNFLYEIAAANEKKAWAVGEDATVLETDDGGETWRKIDLNINNSEALFNDIYNLTIKDEKAWIIAGKFIYTSP